MQLDFLPALAAPQPRRRADPVRARLERREAKRRQLMAAPGDPALTRIAEELFAHGHAVSALREELKAAKGGRAWIGALQRHGLVIAERSWPFQHLCWRAAPAYRR